MSWFRQTAVWGVIISVIATILSQLPPIGSWVASNSVSTEVGSRIGIYHAVGIPGFQIFVDLKNAGNRSINISNMSIEMTYPNGVVKRLGAQSYAKLVSGQTNTLEFPITSIALNSGSNWSELVSFSPDFSPSDDETLARLRLSISQDIFAKLQARGGQMGPVVTADESLAAEALQFFNRKFDLEKGQYHLDIKCAVNGKETLLRQTTFTLFDYHIATIRSQTEDFKYGAGIYFPANQPKQVWTLLSKSS